jgi:hypothetical protein
MTSREQPGTTRVLILGGVLLIAVIITASLVVSRMEMPCPAVACNCTSVPAHEPVFADPAATMREIGDPGYTRQLYAEAVAYEPLLAAPGTQAHMGFYSAKGNHGSLLRLLDAINEGPAAGATPPNRAIWAHGVNAYYQFPSWVRVMDEHWYERAAAVNGTVTIFGRSYQDPYPVTIGQAEASWAEYSRRFADMAGLIARATGKPVKIWCYVEGARPGRIFYTAEYTTLQKLETEGLVEVYFARSQDAEWDNPADWINGTKNAPPPVA